MSDRAHALLWVIGGIALIVMGSMQGAWICVIFGALVILGTPFWLMTSDGS